MLIWCVGAVACPGQQQQVTLYRAFDVVVNTNFFLQQLQCGELLSLLQRASSRGLCTNKKTGLEANVALLVLESCKVLHQYVRQIAHNHKFHRERGVLLQL